MEGDKKSLVEFDVNKNVEEQDISEEASEMIAYLNLEYWCTKEQREELIKQYQKNDDLYEEKMHEKYNPDLIFSNRVQEDADLKKEQNFMLECRKENFWQKMMRKLKRILKNK